MRRLLAALLLIPTFAFAGQIRSGFILGGAASDPEQIVFQDTFQSLSLREGGPTPAGFAAGKGTWNDAGAWYRDGTSAQYVNGLPDFGTGYFVDHAGTGWPNDYNPLGQLRFPAAGDVQLLVSPQSASIQALGASWLTYAAATGSTETFLYQPTNAYWTANGATKSTGTAVDGLAAPAVATLCSSGCYQGGGIQYYATSTLKVGTAYTGTFNFNFGSSNSLVLYIDEGNGGTNAYIYCNSSNVCTGVPSWVTGIGVTTVASHKVLTFTWTPNNSADTSTWTIRFGAGSSTVNDSVSLYTVSLPAPGHGVQLRALSALLAARGAFSIQPPFHVRWVAKMPANQVLTFPALWDISIGRSAATPNAQDYERDTHESFHNNTANQSQFTAHWNATAGGTYNQSALATFNGPVAIAGGGFHVWDEYVNKTGDTTVYVDGNFSAAFGAPTDGANATQAVSILANNAFGDYAGWPGDPPGDLIMDVASVTVYAPASNTSAVVPPTPPVPAIAWRSGFANGVVPVSTANGTVVADLTCTAVSCSSYALAYRGSAPCLSISGSTLVKSATCTAGPLPLYIKGYSAVGVPAFMPTVTATLQ